MSKFVVIRRELPQTPAMRRRACTLYNNDSTKSSDRMLLNMSTLSTKQQCSIVLGHVTRQSPAHPLLSLVLLHHQQGLYYPLEPRQFPESRLCHQHLSLSLDSRNPMCCFPPNRVSHAYALRLSRWRWNRSPIGEHYLDSAGPSAPDSSTLCVHRDLL